MVALLDGVRVLEVGRSIALRIAGSHLAQLGAEVISIEPPGVEDPVRSMGVAPGATSPGHLQTGAGKRSVAIDLGAPSGVELLWRLQAGAAAVLTDLTAAECDRLGIGGAAQLERNPAVVFTQLTPTGATGPYAAIPAPPDGQLSLVGAWPDGGPATLDRPRMALPRRAPDPGQIGGVWAAYLTVAAIVRANTSGVGALVDLSAAEAVVAGSSVPDATALNEHRISDRSTLPPIAGDTDELVGAKYQFYECADGAVVLFGSAEPLFWRNFCTVAERTDLLDEGADQSVIDFRSDDDDLRRVLQEVFRTKTAAEWTRLADANRFICSPAPRTLLEALDDPHLATREVLHRADGYIHVGIPGVIRDHPYSPGRPAPTPGQDTAAVLAAAGVGADELQALVDSGVVAVDDRTAST
jgi:crotonobetainyl-CoA:carnitine CoA-transferase CaiB-like acyl-CoA transferase